MTIVRAIAECVGKPVAVSSARSSIDGLSPMVSFSTLMCCVGDSLTAGQDAPATSITLNKTYHDLYKQRDTTGLLTRINRGVGGTGLKDLITDASNVDALLSTYSGRKVKILSVWIGRNDGDISSAGAYNGGASWIDQLKTYLTARRTAGWTKIVIGTITPYETDPPGGEPTRNAGNVLIRALVGSGHVDAIMDFAASPTIGVWSSKYYQDYVHFNVDGHQQTYTVATPVYNAMQVDATQVGTPYFAPLAGIHDGSQSVVIKSRTQGASIYYTVDGSTPDNTKPLYSGPVTVASSLTAKAIATKSGLTNSEVNSAAYEIISGLYWNAPDLPSGTSLSEGRKLLSVTSADNTKFIRGIIPLTGKKLIEIELDTNGYAAVFTSFGFLKTSVALSSDVNASVLAWARLIVFGSITADGSGVVVSSGATSYIADGQSDKLVAGDRLLLAIDMDNGKAWHRKHNGANGWNTLGSGGLSDPATGAAPHWTFAPSGNWYFACTMNNNSGPNLRLPAIGVSTPPSGFTLLNA